MPTDRAETTPPGRAHPGRVPETGLSTLRRVGVVVGFILLPLGAIILASAPLLHASGWPAAVLVVGGSAVLTAGIGLLAAPARAEHLRFRHEAEHLGRSRRHGGRG